MDMHLYFMWEENIANLSFKHKKRASKKLWLFEIIRRTKDKECFRSIGSTLCLGVFIS